MICRRKAHLGASLAVLFLIAGSAFGQNPQHWMQDLQYRIGNLPLNQVAIPGDALQRNLLAGSKLVAFYRLTLLARLRIRLTVISA